jgi:hypothetical protein
MSQFYFQKSRENDPHALPDGRRSAAGGDGTSGRAFQGAYQTGTLKDRLTRRRKLSKPLDMVSTITRIARR